jgi:hypothetical protein
LLVHPASLFSLTTQGLVFNINLHLFRQLSLLCFRDRCNAMQLLQMKSGAAIHGSICAGCGRPRAGVDAG